jgi:hypothetical protein
MTQNDVQGAPGGDEAEGSKAAKPPKGPPAEAIHIFVNRRKFGAADGVTEQMTGAQIAALAGVPAANAVVRRESGPAQGEVGVDELISLRQAEHFLVTRRTVEGGCGALVGFTLGIC